MKRAISDFKKVNKIKGVDFTEEIMDLFEELRKEKESFAELGIDIEEKAFYDILKALAFKYECTYPDDKLLELAKLVKAEVDDKAKYTDWSQHAGILRDRDGGIQSTPTASQVTDSRPRPLVIHFLQRCTYWPMRMGSAPCS